MSPTMTDMGQMLMRKIYKGREGSFEIQNTTFEIRKTEIQDSKFEIQYLN